MSWDSTPLVGALRETIAIWLHLLFVELGKFAVQLGLMQFDLLVILFSVFFT